MDVAFAISSISAGQLVKKQAFYIFLRPMSTVKARYKGPLCPYENLPYKREVRITKFHVKEDLSHITSLVRMFELLKKTREKQ
jgi:hypothetical protein